MMLTMILAGGAGERLYPLTKDRTKPAVPFAGMYRIIDFTLSNCINSGLRKIYVLTQYKSDSLYGHINQGWNILSPRLDEFIFPLPAQQRTGKDWYKGTGDAIRQNIHKIKDHKSEYVLILSGDHVYKMDYRLMYEYHKNKNADVTVATIEVPKQEAAGKFGVIEVDNNYQMIGFEEKPENPKIIPGTENSLASMGIYLFNKDVLIENLNGHGDDFGKDIIPRMVSENRVFVYNYIKENRIRDYVNVIENGKRIKRIKEIKDSSYWRDVGTILSYHDTHMDLVGVDPALDLYGNKWPLRTLRPETPPAKFVLGGTANDSIISDGCIISGGKVNRSVLSPGVIVEMGSIIDESVIMNDVQIGNNVRIKRAIIDKECEISSGTYIGYDLESDKRRGFTVDSGIVVVPKGTKL